MKKSYLLMLIILIIAILPYNMIFSKAEELVSGISSDEPTIAATLYNDNQYTTGTELTEEGTQIDGWQYETSKYLQINPSVPADGNTYIVTVELPQEFYFVTSELIAPTGYQNVEFTKNESLTVNDGETYDLKAYSGTAKFTMNNMGTSGTIQLEIRYDMTLWDKREGSRLTPEGLSPIKVILSKEDSAGNVVELESIYVDKATAGEGHMYGGGTSNIIEGIGYTEHITINMNKNFWTHMSIAEGNYGYNCYYPVMQININLPFYTDSSGKKYYLTPNINEIIFNSNLATFEIDTTQMFTNGNLIITIKDTYFNPFNLLKMEFGPLGEELQKLDQNEFLFAGGEIIVEANSKNGDKDFLIFTTNIQNVTYQKELLESIALRGIQEGTTITERPEEAVSVLGRFEIENKGTGKSCEKRIKIDFDSNNTNLIKVTTFNVPVDTVQQYIDITYTLVDDMGNKVYLNQEGEKVTENEANAIGEWVYSMKNSCYNSSNIVNIRTTLIRSMLPENQRNYYFKTIQYTIKTINEGTKLYAHQANKSFSGGGNFLGYLNGNAQNVQSVISSIEIISSNPDIKTLTGVARTVIQEVSNPTYMLNNVNLSKETIKAGESLEVKGRIEGCSYPYGNSTWLKGISLGIILPQEALVNEQSILITTAKGTKVDNLEITNKQLQNGDVLWIIKLPTYIYIGYVSESLGGLNNGIYIDFKMQIDTAYTINGSTLFAKDMLILAGYKQINAAGGTYSWSSKIDTYDLNANGLTSDTIAGVSSSNTANCTIIAQNQTLDIDNTISVDRQGSITEEGTEQSILSDTDIINYNIDIGSSSGGVAEEFEYYIPIPKSTSKSDAFLINGDAENFFDFSIIEHVTRTGDDLFNIQYAFDVGVNYEQAKKIETWYTADEIDTDENLLWEDVTLIKLTLKGESIENGNSTRLTVKMKYGGNNYGKDAGTKNSWNAGGYYYYNINGREVSGNYTTSPVTVDLKYTLELEEITLTAAPNMTPQIEGNVNTKTIEKKSFPEFKNAHTFSITAVDTYNVMVQTKEYIESNIDMPGINANNTFAITINMDETEKDILSLANPIEIGSSIAGESPQFTFKIYNANELSDNLQTRYIIVTLTSDNGVTIKQKININREIKEATDPNSAIVAGKRYVIFDDTTSEVEISQDSAFTAQFVVSYIPDLYNGQNIVFSNNLPIGTKLILGNITKSDNPNYWYYIVESECSNINIQDFISMGTTQTKNYTLLTGADTVEEKIIVLVDFSQCESGYITEGTHTIKMVLDSSNTSVDSFNSKELSFITKQKRKFELTIPTNSTFGEEFEITYLMQDTEGADSKYDGRKLSLVMKAPESLPPDTKLVVEDITYYLNANKQFIVPLDDMSNMTDTFRIQMNSDILPNTKTQYKFAIELWVSATANANAPMFGELVDSGEIIITNEGKIQPALKVTDMNKRVIHKNELSEKIEASFEYVIATDCSVTLELQQKIGTAYQKVTDRLNQVNNTTNHSMGVFNVNATGGTNQVTLSLSSATSNSTYRLLFKVNDSKGSKLLEIPYNFIVTN